MKTLTNNKETIRLLSLRLQSARFGLENAKDALRRHYRKKYLDEESKAFLFERLTGMFFAVKEIEAKLRKEKCVLL